MRKTLTRLAVAAGLAAVLVASLMLAACGGGLSGTYVPTGGASDTSFAQFNNERLMSVEFKPFGNAEIVTFRVSTTTTTTYTDGSYKVDGSRLTLKAEWNYSDEWEGTYSFSQSGDSIYIDGHRYTNTENT